MITVGELCNRAVVIVGKEDTLQEAARLMRDHHVGALVIAEERDGKRFPIGMVTDRDLVVGVLAREVEHLGQLMVRDVVTSWDVVTAGEDESALELFKRMRAFGVRRLPVIDAGGALVGIVAFDDLVGLLAEFMTDLDRVLTREVAVEEERRP